MRFAIRLLAPLFALAAVTATAGTGDDYLAVAPAGKTVKLENPHVRVIECVLAPGAKEAVHTHPANFAYALAPGKARVSYVGGESQEFELKTGDTVWSDPEGPHTLQNTGKKPLRYLLVEMRDLPYVAANK